MRQVLIMLCLAFAPGLASAQAASADEQALVAEIAQCIVQGAPDDWDRLTMVVMLENAGDDTGQVRYFATRAGAPDQPVGYVPCDLSRPPRVLLDSRKDLAPERRGWTAARLFLQRDGRFGLSYDYPK